MCLIYTMHTKVANPLRNQKKTKKPKGPSQNHSKTIEKTKKKQKKHSSHTLWGAWAGQDDSHYRRNAIYYRENHENSTKILDFRDNNSHPGQPRPPIVCENLVFVCLLWVFSMVLLWFWEGAFVFFLFLEAFGHLWDVTT